MTTQQKNEQTLTHCDEMETEDRDQDLEYERRKRRTWANSYKFPELADIKDSMENYDLDSIDTFQVHAWMLQCYENLCYKRDSIDKESIRKIGLELYAIGGKATMRDFHGAFAELSPSGLSENPRIRSLSSDLEICWDGIGDWKA